MDAVKYFRARRALGVAVALAAICLFVSIVVVLVNAVDSSTNGPTDSVAPFMLIAAFLIAPAGIAVAAWSIFPRAGLTAGRSRRIGRNVWCILAGVFALALTVFEVIRSILEGGLPAPVDFAAPIRVLAAVTGLAMLAVGLLRAE